MTMKPLHAAAAVLLLAMLAGCASTLPRNPLGEWHGSPNHGPRRARAIVLHHTAMDSAQAALRTLQTRNAGGPVSSHYLIGDDGRLYQLVSEQARCVDANANRGDIAAAHANAAQQQSRSRRLSFKALNRPVR